LLSDLEYEANHFAVNKIVYNSLVIAYLLLKLHTPAMERKRSDLIADALEALILDGTFSDGERLNEQQLSKRFNVSRTPLREALQRLANTGLVVQRPRRGVFVSQPGPIELIEMFEVMAELEAACAGFAASRITEEALGELHDTNTRCDAAIGSGDADLYFRENETFHSIIYREAGNGFLEAECLRLHKRLHPFRRMQLRLRGRMDQSMREHKAIVAALEAGDGPAAAQALRVHVAVQGEKFHRLMASLKSAAE